MNIVKATTFDGKEIAIDLDGVITQQEVKRGTVDCVLLKTKHGAEYVIWNTKRRDGGGIVGRVLHL